MRINYVSGRGFAIKEKATTTKEKEREQGVNKETEQYAAKSKDGDTLELTEGNKKKVICVDKKADEQGNKKITDAALARYSIEKLKQLVQNKMISKQQYERVIKMRKE